MDIHNVKLESLTEDPKNARIHNEKNLTAIRTSLSRFGQVEPLVVQAESGIVIGGNGRLQAMRSLGWERADVSYVNLNNEQATALGIALNRTAELATWDHEQLNELLEALDVGDEFDGLEDVGFDSGDMDALAEELKPEPVEVVEDEAPEPPKEPTAKIGDIWVLGDHRVFCGDCADAEYPEYEAVLTPDVTWLLDLAPKTLIWGGNYFDLPPSGSWAVWDKRAGTDIVNTFADVELAWSNYGGPARIHRQLWNGMIREGEREKRQHPTQKPVNLMMWCMKLLNSDSLIDPFLGSGTTLIAAEQLGRKCYGVELSPAYVDVIIQRWENLTGKKAILEK